MQGYSYFQYKASWEVWLITEKKGIQYSEELFGFYKFVLENLWGEEEWTVNIIEIRETSMNRLSNGLQKLD